MFTLYVPHVAEIAMSDCLAFHFASCENDFHEAKAVYMTANIGLRLARHGSPYEIICRKQYSRDGSICRSVASNGRDADNGVIPLYRAAPAISCRRPLIFSYCQMVTIAFDFSRVINVAPWHFLMAALEPSACALKSCMAGKLSCPPSAE